MGGDICDGTVKTQKLFAKHFRVLYIYGGDEQPLKQEKLKTFIAENNIETLNGRTLNNKVALLRVKINNEKEIAEENAIRALKNISKTK